MQIDKDTYPKHRLWYIYGYINGWLMPHARKNRITKKVQIWYYNETFSYWTWVDIYEKYYDKFIENERENKRIVKNS